MPERPTFPFSEITGNFFHLSCYNGILIYLSTLALSKRNHQWIDQGEFSELWGGLVGETNQPKHIKSNRGRRTLNLNTLWWSVKTKSQDSLDDGVINACCRVDELTRSSDLATDRQLELLQNLRKLGSIVPILCKTKLCNLILFCFMCLCPHTSNRKTNNGSPGSTPTYRWLLLPFWK